MFADTNIGIIQGVCQKMKFLQDPLRIYSAIQNNSGDDIQGSQSFLIMISTGKKGFHRN